jgi:transcriptional regulator with XRE-family HTH domain
MNEVNQVSEQYPDIGLRVRNLRQRRGLSLRTLADLCDLSPNTISLIERGTSSPSVATLQSLATALGVPVVSFFEEREDPPHIIVTRAGERTRSGNAGVLLEGLGNGLENQTIEPYLVTLNPGAGARKPMMAHTGHELVHCLCGELIYEVANQQYRLREGDSLLFEARLSHSWFNPGQEPVKFLLVFQAALARETLNQHLYL